MNRSAVSVIQDGKVAVDALGVETEDHSQADEVQEGEGEETHVDPLAEGLPEEHRHVDDVGRRPDDVEDEDEDGGLESADEKLCLPADQVRWNIITLRRYDYSV